MIECSLGMQTRGPNFGLPFHTCNRNPRTESKKSKAKAYRTKGGNRQLVDIYTDDLSIYLRYDLNNKQANENNVLEILTTIGQFYKWSGLKSKQRKDTANNFWQKISETQFCGKS